MSDQVILINAFKVPDGKLQESIEYWERHRDFMKGQSGYISTKLHQSILPDATFRLVNIAIWESQDAFYTAAQKMRQELNDVQVEGLSGDPALYHVVRE
jgi:heme-degrading monooxygenase HmoA